MSSIAYIFAHKRVLGIEEVVEEWLLNHKETDLASATEQLVQETISTIACIKSVAAPYEKGLRPGTKTEEIVVTHQIGALLEKMLELLARVKSITEEMGRSFSKIQHLDELLSLENELVDLKNEFAKKWMLPDKEKIRKAKSEIAEGKYRIL